MTTAAAPPRIADDRLAELLELVRGADSVELKFSPAETRAHLAQRGIDLAGEQETKTKRALEFFSARRKQAKETT